jgi:hypothetical protein
MGRDETKNVPVLRRAKAQAEAGPLMLLMERHADMRPSIAGGGPIAKRRMRGKWGISGRYPDDQAAKRAPDAVRRVVPRC